MSKNHYFRVSYRLGGQARSTQVQAETPVLTPEQARYHVESLHSELPNEITDIDIQPLGAAQRQKPGQARQT